MGRGVGKTAIVTGASSGIGYHAAIDLAKEGFTVYAMARRAERLAGLEKYNIVPFPADVTKPEDVDALVAAVQSATGRVDVLVNNAGYGSYGALEEVPLSHAKAQYDVNVFGLASITQRVLPLMRAQHSGTIINISSMGGDFFLPLGAWYHSSKFAVEGLSDCLRNEVRSFGIKVVVIKPGIIKTEWSDIARDTIEGATATENGAYSGLATKISRSLGTMYSSPFATKPEKISSLITKVALSSHPRPRYTIGYSAKPLVFIFTLFPTWFKDGLLRVFIGSA